MVTYPLSRPATGDPIGKCVAHPAVRGCRQSAPAVLVAVAHLPVVARAVEGAHLEPVVGALTAAVEPCAFVARAVRRRHDQATRAPVGREGVVVPRLLVVPREEVGRGHAWRVDEPAGHALARSIALRVLAFAAQGKEVGVQASGGLQALSMAFFNGGFILVTLLYVRMEVTLIGAFLSFCIF